MNDKQTIKGKPIIVRLTDKERKYIDNTKKSLSLTLLSVPQPGPELEYAMEWAVLRMQWLSEEVYIRALKLGRAQGLHSKSLRKTRKLVQKRT